MATKPVKICILGASFNTDNMGVSVLAAGALRCVLQHFPNADVFQMDYEHHGYDFQFNHNDAPVNIRFVNIRFSKKPWLKNHIAALIVLAAIYRLIPLSGVRSWSLSRNAWFREMIEAQLVFSLAGGDSFSDIYGLRRLLYTSLPQVFAVLAGKRLVLLPQTIGPFRSLFSKFIARYILSHAEIVYSRDRPGQRATKALLGSAQDDNKVRFCYDLGFDVEPAKATSAQIVGLDTINDTATPVVGINISGLLAIGGYNRNNMFGLKADYNELILRLLQLFIEQQSAKVLLVPHVLGSSSESDIIGCEKVFESVSARYKNKIGLVRGATNYAEIKYIIGRCDFFVGARMHACIAALSQTVPAISVAYSDKFIGVMDSIGIRDLVVDPRVMNEDEIVSKIEKLFEQRSVIRRALEKHIPLVKQEIRTSLTDLDVHSSPMQLTPASAKAHGC